MLCGDLQAPSGRGDRCCEPDDATSRHTKLALGGHSALSAAGSLSPPSSHSSTIKMAQAEAAKALANLLSKVARYSVILGIGGSALQSALYTGVRRTGRGAAAWPPHALPPPTPTQRGSWAPSDAIHACMSLGQLLEPARRVGRAVAVAAAACLPLLPPAPAQLRHREGCRSAASPEQRSLWSRSSSSRCSSPRIKP